MPVLSSHGHAGVQLLTLVAVALSTNVLVGSSDRWRPVFITAILGVTITSEVRQPKRYAHIVGVLGS